MALCYHPQAASLAWQHPGDTTDVLSPRPTCDFLLTLPQTQAPQSPPQPTHSPLSPHPHHTPTPPNTHTHTHTHTHTLCHPSPAKLQPLAISFASKGSLGWPASVSGVAGILSLISGWKSGVSSAFLSETHDGTTRVCSSHLRSQS